MGYSLPFTTSNPSDSQLQQAEKDGDLKQRPSYPLLTELWKDPPFLMGQSTISMAIFQFAFCLFTIRKPQFLSDMPEMAPKIE